MHDDGVTLADIRDAHPGPRDEPRTVVPEPRAGVISNGSLPALMTKEEREAAYAALGLGEPPPDPEETSADFDEAKAWAREHKASGREMGAKFVRLTAERKQGAERQRLLRLAWLHVVPERARPLRRLPPPTGARRLRPVRRTRTASSRGPPDPDPDRTDVGPRCPPRCGLLAVRSRTHGPPPVLPDASAGEAPGQGGAHDE
jgi:hypothetical protein